MRTQLPYAVLAALASIAGFVTAAITMNGFISLAVSIVCMVLFLYIMNRVDKGRHPESETTV